MKSDHPEDAPNYSGDTQRAHALTRAFMAPVHGPPLNPDQQRLLDPGPRVDQPWMQHPDDWVRRPDTFFHGTDGDWLEDYVGPNPQAEVQEDMHFGTFAAAAERLHKTEQGHRDASKNRIVPLRLTRREQQIQVDDGMPTRWGDSTARQYELDDLDAPTAFYRNNYEDKGSVSGVTEPAWLRTWADDVQAAEAAGRNVGQVRSQMAAQNRQLSYNTEEAPLDFPEKYTQGSMIAHSGGGEAPIIDGARRSWVMDRHRYQVHGQEVGPDNFHPVYGRFGKPRR